MVFKIRRWQIIREYARLILLFSYVGVVSGYLEFNSPATVSLGCGLFAVIVALLFWVQGRGSLMVSSTYIECNAHGRTRIFQKEDIAAIEAATDKNGRAFALRFRPRTGLRRTGWQEYEDMPALLALLEQFGTVTFIPKDSCWQIILSVVTVIAVPFLCYVLAKLRGFL